MSTLPDFDSVKKSVCFIVTAESTATTFYRGYVRFLHNHGWDVVVLAASNGKLESWATSEGAKAIVIPFAREPDLAKDLIAFIRVVVILRQMRPSVVVSATPKAGLVGTTAAWLTRVPVRIYALWGLRLETTTGVKMVVLKACEKIAMHCATSVLANSQSLAKIATRLGLPGRKRIEVVGPGSSHGVNTRHFSLSACYGAVDSYTECFLRNNPAELTVCFIGRMSPDKGISCLLSAVALAARNGVRLRLILVGKSEDSATERLIVNHDTKLLVHWVPNVDDVRPYLEIADVLCLPTLREGFPNVVLEAASMGIPAIVSSATGAIDSVQDGVTGWIVSVNDVDGFAHRFAWCAAHLSQLKFMGSVARKRVEREYTQSYVWSINEDYIKSQLLSLYKRRRG
jgi:glycosyltransferase involved in cell wall biosynthesis